MNILPNKLDQVLGEDIYKREDKEKAKEFLTSLGVEVSDTFSEFYHRYAGPFWEEYVPYELLDIVDEENNIESNTIIARNEHGFPKKYLVLSEMSANAVLVLDSVTDKVYSVNFEGGDELLLNGELKETWSSFYAFLKEYFNC
ncbi:SMI1/KNR4 family protein [Bacillus sp. DX1.1]|uniref:SMI1/KNR4 family protein n=1 Tax=unclassified Bacillus (in: firmicutes) TaxID=185979 RepID=UPI0025706F38|nr:MULTISPECIES: SMI1/KNR4 family protein [unclassified Bacillus (in: firmicutes)]MDM5155474.1 SMI1/KNR4 family protein [Bacillus sp. DX1.1]WJE79787.1 SMI1/KNR4 family protein [Bacillus sp. DX3.1]